MVAATKRELLGAGAKFGATTDWDEPRGGLAIAARPYSLRADDQRRQSIRLIVVPAVFDRAVLALDQACFLQALVERIHAVCGTDCLRACRVAD